MVGGTRRFSVFSSILMIILAAVCVLPFILLIVSSVTNEITLIQYGYSFFIRDFDFSAYLFLFSRSGTILRAYGMTILVAGIGTFCNVMLTLFIAYLLSKKDLPGRNFFSFFVFFTMLFSGGMIPSYIIWSRVFNVTDTILGLILPNLLLGPFNIILMRTYFTANVPQEIQESAEIDGCSQVRMLFSIAIPLARPMIATVALFSMLGYWNDWINGLYYIVSAKDLQTIQVVLNQLQNFNEFIKRVATQSSGGEAAAMASAAPTLQLRMGLAVISILPILALYPFFQKQFVKGIVVGGIKG